MWGGRAWGKQRRQGNSPPLCTVSAQLRQRDSSPPPCTRHTLMHQSSPRRDCTSPLCTVSAQLRQRDSSLPPCMVLAQMRQRDSSPPPCTADMKMLLSRRRHCNRRQDRKRSRGRTACGQNQQ